MSLKLVHPSTMLVSGPTGSGKSQFVAKVLFERLFNPFPEKITWIYGEWQPLYDQLQIQIPEIEFITGLPPNIYSSFNPKNRNLLILDDQMSEAGGSKELSDLFTKGSHHRNLSVVFLVQNLFDKGRSMRTVSLNTQYLVIFKNPRDKTQINFLARQMFPNNTKFLVDAFEDATLDPYGYILLDLHQQTPEEFRVRSKIFNGEDAVAYEPVGYKRK